MDKKDDRFYIKKVLAGEVNAYGFLVDRHKAMAFTLAFKLVRNREEAEEIAQDAFVKAYQSLSSFRGGSRFSTWLYRIVYNTAISHLRKTGLDAISIEDSELINSESDQFYDAMNIMSRSEKSKYLNLALRKLDEEENFLLTLYYFEEKSLDDIGKITGLTKNYIKVKIFRARKKLESILQLHLKDELTGIL